MCTIYDREDELWNFYSAEDQAILLKDGLCLSDIKFANNIQDQSILERYWINSDIRILFLLKEGVNQQGDDYRDYQWGSEKCQCKIKPNLREILWHLNNLQSAKLDENEDKLDPKEKVFDKYPFAIVNLKKLPRDREKEGSYSNWEELRSITKRDKEILKKHIRDILAPNIIVCCGYESGADSIIAIASEIIYEGIEFEDFKIGNDLWCKYNLDEKIFLLNSYHLTFKDCDAVILKKAFRSLILDLFQKKYLK